MTRMLVLAMTAALAACAHTQPAAVTTTSVTIPQAPKVETSGAALDVQTDLGTTADGRISDGIYAGILSDPKLGIAAQEVDITTRNGNVVLTGHVHSDAERTEIDQKARNTAGVQNVDDRIEVAP